MIPDPETANAAGKECLFCQIARGAMKVELEHEDEDCVAFHDINPQAPVHILVIPRRHLQSLAECSSGEQALLGRLLEVAALLARQHGAEANGYRVVLNTGSHGGQSVPHLHLHLLAGRPLAWPPG